VYSAGFQRNAVTFTEFGKNMLHGFSRLLFLNHFFQFRNVLLVHFFTHFRFSLFHVTKCFGFKKSFTLIPYARQIFSIKAKRGNLFLSRLSIGRKHANTGVYMSRARVTLVVLCDAMLIAAVVLCSRLTSWLTAPCIGTA
jgi:hypothetical protein